MHPWSSAQCPQTAAKALAGTSLMEVAYMTAISACSGLASGGGPQNDNVHLQGAVDDCT